MDKLSIVSLREIDDVDRLANNLRDLLRLPQNSDITEEFPRTVARYTDDIEQVIANLIIDRDAYVIGQREQFVAFSGSLAVGLSTVISRIKTPLGIPPEWPNLSSFICRPYRGLGLGRLSMEVRMKVVQRNFGDHAWSLVRRDNEPSRHLIEDFGFVDIDGDIEGWPNHTLYLYDYAE